jgi:drug/metabolite transporter (DMT)-like permease
VASVLGGGLLVTFAPWPARQSWVYLGVSAALHAGYNLLLLRSYQLGHFGQVYPLARGTAPWLVVLTASMFLGERLPPARLAGVAVLSAGLLTLVLAGGRPTRADLPAVLAALGTGVTIAAYTTVDGVGVRASGTTLGYTGWLFLLQGAVVPLVALALRGRQLPTQARPHLATGLLGGLLSMLAYGLVLWAQTRGALAPIAALRETSVIVGGIIATVRFHEPFGRTRVIATILVAAGVVLINF